MTTLTIAPEMRLDQYDDEPPLLVSEFDLPREHKLDDDAHAETERERYDEQILAALVSP